MSTCRACREGRSFPLAVQAAFHPILDLAEERVFAYEALIRGPNGEGAGDVLAQVTEPEVYSFDQACRVTAIRDSVAAGIVDTGARLSINFLPNAIYSPRACLQLTLRTARETGFPAERLIFEFTENETLNSDHVAAIIAEYRRFGFLTAIDDFGAGYAGLGLLARLSTDLLKLDMALVRDCDADPRRRAILESLVRLASRLDLTLIAEGIETEAELATLQLLGIRYVQGFLFGEPRLKALDPYPDWLRTQPPQRRAS